MPSRTASPAHIPYLDGLRGYSILTVVVLHCVNSMDIPQWLLPLTLLFGNGQLGVDIFFVISGFLITTLLLQEQSETGTISVRGFYERRIARIFPAAYFYIAVIAILTLLGALRLRAGAFAAAGLFSWNYGSVLGLFAGSEDAEVLNHFWSLSLEEQFYLLWPSCLLLLGLAGSRRLAWIFVILMPLARILSYALFPKSRGQLTLMFHTGADQIYWGALAAFAYTKGAHLAWASSRRAAWMTFAYSVFAIFVVGGAAIYVHAVGRFIAPTVYCSSAALLILWLVSNSKGIIRAALECRPLRFIGVLSYSLYVWQQLFLALQSPLRVPLPWGLVCAFLAAMLSYYWVEVPLRNSIRQFFRQRPLDGTPVPVKPGQFT